VSGRRGDGAIPDGGEAVPLGLLLEGEASLAEAWLQERGFEGPQGARRALQSIFRTASDPALALRFLEAALEGVRECPDPDRALNHLVRWVAQLAGVREGLAALLADPRLLHDLLLLFGTSDYLADILVREPSLYALLTAEGEERAPLAARLDAAVLPFSRPASRLDALRRFKRREFLRIAARDLTGRADFAATVRAISDLADGLIARALATCEEELAPSQAALSPLAGGRGGGPTHSAAALSTPPFAVIAMGKLGARELNYSSDVDLIFLCDVAEADGPLPGDERGMRQATRLAEALVAALSKPTAEGNLFRVDMRLRPEGRFGALVRSLASYREYYDRWVETWERQALIKARFVAGDAELGARFERMVEPHVYRRVHSTALLEDVRDVKRAIDRRVDQAGERENNVKEGRGTIREIEFAVQLLQLLFGGERPDLRARDTLTALARLTAAGLLTQEEAATLGDQYRFFRSVEHRLQLMSDLPTRRIPDDPGERRKLARRMGYPPEACDGFMADYAARASAVERITGALVRRLAGGAEEAAAPEADLRDRVLALAGPEGGASPAARAALEAELGRLGFPEPAAAAESVTRLALGGPHVALPASTRRAFADLAEALLPRAAASPDPEGALRVVEGLARRMGTYQTFYRTLAEQPDMLAALCVVAGTSPWIAEEVTRRPELLDAMTDPEFLRAVRPREALLAEVRRRRDAMRGRADRRNALRRFRKRELLRIAARDLLLGVPAREITAELALLADVCLEVALELAWEGALGRTDAVRGFAVIGMGRLGGEELHYSSDLDLLYLYDPRRGPEGLTHTQYEALAASASGTMQELGEEGRLYEIDLRLRPEGKSALLLVHLDAARQYYGAGGRSQTWEKQALIKARPVAGDGELAAAFLAVVAPEVYPLDPPAERDAEVRAMKRRIETERVREGERPRNVKLGPGGLSDVEFLVQRLQLRHGGRYPSVRARNTFDALAALAAAADAGVGRPTPLPVDAGGAPLLAPADAALLADHYAFLTRLRQRLYLRSSGVASDLLPTDPAELRRLARTVALPDADALHAEYTRRTGEVRAVFTRCFG
jgi:glutamate-ammonia-ligase adenylyltransferase